MRDYRSLPEHPPRPHDFQSLQRHSVTLKLAEPLTLSFVEAGHGPPILLVHGLMTSAYSFRYVITALAHDHRVIALDLPGAGKSDAPPALSQSPRDLAEVIAAFIAALNLDRPYIVGNSMGGYVSLWMSLLHPERVGRLMIMHSPGFPEARLYLLHAALSIPGNRWIFDLISRNHEQFALDNVHYKNESLKSREETREYAGWTTDPNRREIFRRNLLETMSPFSMSELPAAVASARSAGKLPPIRLLWSKWDPLVSPKLGPRYQKLLPEAELVWLDASHFLHVDAPEETVREVLRFAAS